MPPPDPTPPPLPAAVLRHTLADGSAHFDLLLARRAADDPDARIAATWRCDADPAALAPGGSCACTAIHDHRALYLTLGAARELGEGRGRVEPVARGEWTPDADWTPDGGGFAVRWHAGAAARLRIDAGRLHRAPDAATA